MIQSKRYLCECKNVTKAEILKLIREGTAENILHIQTLTKASTGCGRCKPTIKGILNDELAKIKRGESQLDFDFK